MKRVLLDQDEIDALSRRGDELLEQTLKLYDGGWHTDAYIQNTEQRCGRIPVLMVCIALIMALCGVFYLVRWLVQSSAP